MTSPYHIEVRDDGHDEVVLDDRVKVLIEQSVVQTLIHESVLPPAEITVLITSNKVMRQMNNSFRGIDKVTDVLSFPSGEVLDGAQNYLGDIAISAQYAKRQAEYFGNSFEEELQLLAVHATLHLLGHDHALEQERELMWSSQASVLQSLGISGIHMPTDGD